MPFACPECQDAVSPNAKSCPSCGAILSVGFDESYEDRLELEDTDPDAACPYDDFDTNPGKRHGGRAKRKIPSRQESRDRDSRAGGPNEGSSRGGREKRGPDKPEKAKDEQTKPLLRIPWGHLILIGLYFVAAGSLLFFDYWTSEHAAIGRHLRSADRLLGHRMGAVSSNEELIEAADHYLAALAIEPHLELPQKRMDIINARLTEKGSSLPEDLKRRHAALSARVQMERAAARKGLFADMPVNPTDRFRLREQGSRAKRNSYIFFGGLVVLLGWVFLRTSAKKLSTREARGPADDEDDGRFIS